MIDALSRPGGEGRLKSRLAVFGSDSHSVTDTPSNFGACRFLPRASEFRFLLWPILILSILDNREPVARFYIYSIGKIGVEGPVVQQRRRSAPKRTSIAPTSSARTATSNGALIFFAPTMTQPKSAPRPGSTAMP